MPYIAVIPSDKFLVLFLHLFSTTCFLDHAVKSHPATFSALDAFLYFMVIEILSGEAEPWELLDAHDTSNEHQEYCFISNCSLETEGISQIFRWKLFVTVGISGETGWEIWSGISLNYREIWVGILNVSNSSWEPKPEEVVFLLRRSNNLFQMTDLGEGSISAIVGSRISQEKFAEFLWNQIMTAVSDQNRLPFLIHAQILMPPSRLPLMQGTTSLQHSMLRSTARGWQEVIAERQSWSC